MPLRQTDAIKFPLGLIVRIKSSTKCTSIGFSIASPVPALHLIIVPSLDPVTIRFPSSLIAMALAHYFVMCVHWFAYGFPVDASHLLTIPSPSPGTISVPSLLIATECTPLLHACSSMGGPTASTVNISHLSRKPLNEPVTASFPLIQTLRGRIRLRYKSDRTPSVTVDKRCSSVMFLSSRALKIDQTENRKYLNRKN